MRERRRYFTRMGLAGAVVIPIVYWQVPMRAAVAPSWVALVTGFLGVGFSAVVLASLRPSRVANKPRKASGVSLTRATAEKPLSMASAAAMNLPLLFGAFGVHLTGSTTAYPLFIIASAVLGFVGWLNLPKAIEALPEDSP